MRLSVTSVTATEGGFSYVIVPRAKRSGEGLNRGLSC